MSPRLTRWMIMLGLWAIVGLALSIEVYFSLQPAAPNVSFGSVALPQYIRAMYWALLAPVVLELWEQAPLRRGRWIGGILFHACMSFLVMSGFFCARMFYLLLTEGETLAAFWDKARHSFFGRNLIDMAFYWGVLAYGRMQQLHQRVKNEELKAAQLESRLIETELKELKQQLHPHFLFNTLNTISVLVREKRNEDAVRLLARLSALLRMSLDSRRVHEVSLRQEMEFLEPYLDIQKARFLDRLSVKMQLEPETLDARIPHLLLQPIVENAIVHGIAGKSDPGTVQISAAVHDGSLVLDVKDDGPGFKAAPGTDRIKEGIGLTNTRERLAKIYGSHCQLRLRSEAGQGTTVQIVLPFRI